MAFTLSRYLRLRLDSNLTANALYNLKRIDELAATFNVDTISNVNIRSESDLVLEPESADIGGSGTGGSVSIGTSSHTIDSLNVYASSLNFSSPLGFLDSASGGSKYLRVRYKSDLSGSVDTTSDRILSLDLNGADRSLVLGGDLFFPTNSSGYAVNDGAGNITWAPISGGGDVLGYETDWVTGDGTTKAVMHGLGSQDVQVSVYDESDDLILVEVNRTSTSTVTLTSSEVPASSWRVVVQAN